MVAIAPVQPLSPTHGGNLGRSDFRPADADIGGQGINRPASRGEHGAARLLAKARILYLDIRAVANCHVSPHLAHCAVLPERASTRLPIHLQRIVINGRG
jgi:hypothetical protein